MNSKIVKKKFKAKDKKRKGNIRLTENPGDYADASQSKQTLNQIRIIDSQY